MVTATYHKGACVAPVHPGFEKITVSVSKINESTEDTEEYASYDAATGKLTAQQKTDDYTITLKATAGNGTELGTKTIRVYQEQENCFDIARGNIIVTASAEEGKITYTQGSVSVALDKGADVFVTGTTDQYTLKIQTDATVILKDLSIQSQGSARPIEITNNATATLLLVGETELHGSRHLYDSRQTATAALFVDSGSTLIIDSERVTEDGMINEDIDEEHGGNKQVAYAGSLHAETSTETVVARPASAIGGDYKNGYACGNITILGGNVTAISHGTPHNKFVSASAIGAGPCLSALSMGVETEFISTCGEIMISGGNVRAEYAGVRGRGISSGESDLTITGGVVYATAPNDGANADASGSIFSYGGTITIGAENGGEDSVYVYATTSTKDLGQDAIAQAAIGGGNGVNIVVNSGTVYAESTGKGAAIGGGVTLNDAKPMVAEVGKITINGGTITTANVSEVNGGEKAVGIGVAMFKNYTPSFDGMEINGGTIYCVNTSIGYVGDIDTDIPMTVSGSDTVIDLTQGVGVVPSLDVTDGATLITGNGISLQAPANGTIHVTADSTTLPAGTVITYPEPNQKEYTIQKLPDGTTITMDEKGELVIPAGGVITDGNGKEIAFPYGGYIDTEGNLMVKAVVTFDANGGIFGDGSNQQTQEGYVGETTITYPENPIWSKHIFRGWVDETGQMYDEKIMTGTVTLKAQWKKKSTSDSTSGSTSGSSSEQNYSISISDRIENGKVKASVSQAEKGDKVTITVTPNEDYEINKVTVKDADGNKIELKDQGDGKYTFIMPASKVEIVAAFAKAEETASAAEERKAIILTINQRLAYVFGIPVMNDVPPVIQNDRAMLPIRFVVEKLGGTVAWDDTQKKVTITKEELTIELFIDQPFALVNGEPVALDSPAFIENDRTYLPIRFVAENLGADVTWNQDTQEVTIIPN